MMAKVAGCVSAAQVVQRVQSSAGSRPAVPARFFVGLAWAAGIELAVFSVCAFVWWWL